MDNKPWWQSKTIIGAITGGVPTLVIVLNFFGVNIADLSSSLTTGLLGLVGLIGTIVAIIGRFQAWKTPALTIGGKVPAIILAAALLITGSSVTLAGVDTTTPLGPTGQSDVAPTPPPAPTSSSWASSLFTELSNAEANHFINVDLAPIWAPKLTGTGPKWGLDLDINHPIGNYAAIGLRFRYFNGDTYAGGVGLGLKDTFQINNRISVQPYVGAGELNSIRNGGGVEPIAFAETGAKIFFYQSETGGVADGRFQVFGLGGIEYDSNLPGVQIFRVGGGVTLSLGSK